MLNNVDEASPEKTKKRKRRIQAEILQDFKKKLAEAIKHNKTMTKELPEEKKKEKLEKKQQKVQNNTRTTTFIDFLFI